MPGLGTVRLQMLQHSVGGWAHILLLERLFGREYDESKSSVVRYVRVRRENVDAVERWDVRKELLQHILDFVPHVRLQVEPALPVLHFTTQVGPCVEPESGRVDGLVP